MMQNTERRCLCFQEKCIARAAVNESVCHNVRQLNTSCEGLVWFPDLTVVISPGRVLVPLATTLDTVSMPTISAMDLGRN